MAITAMVAADAVSAGTLRFPAAVDARVEEAYPDSNFGSSYLRVDDGDDLEVRTYLRFDANDVSGTIVAATLGIYATTVTLDGAAVYANGTDWAEDDITWNTRPWRASIAADETGVVVRGGWVDLNVTPLVRSAGKYGFVLRGALPMG